MAEAAQNAFKLGSDVSSLSEEHVLLLRCVEGDWSGYGRIVERYRRMVWAVVDAVLNNKDDVPDVVQEVFIRAFQKLGTFRFQCAFSSWLYRLARNHAISHLRTARRRPSSFSLDFQVEGGHSAHERLPGPLQPDDAYYEGAREEALAALLARLDVAYREVINLHYLGDFTYEEIAELVGVPVNTVKTRLRRGKLRLQQLAERGGWR